MTPADAARAAARLAAAVAASKVAHHLVCCIEANARAARAAARHDAADAADAARAAAHPLAVAVGTLTDRFLAGDPDAWDLVVGTLNTIQILVEDSDG